MRRQPILICILCIAHWLFSQPATPYLNLIPNPSFEELTAIPQEWFYTGAHFTQCSNHWNSPTSASPDLYGPRLNVPRHWREKGFGKMYAKDGSYCAGITMYGCDNGKPHCREYIQVLLDEPLVPGQLYEMTLWVAHLDGSLWAGNLGGYFSEDKISEIGASLLEKDPQVLWKDAIVVKEGSWLRLQKTFSAEVDARYLTIGNFFPDDRTTTSGESFLNYAYYYLDDVSVHKIDPILTRDTSTLVPDPVETNRFYALNNIYFDYDESTLLPASYHELNKLLKVMREHPDWLIQIHGHTDIFGDAVYNQHLSVQRARAVVNYLIKYGIEPRRVTYVGHGSQQPIASNAKEAGRQMNRRVEFKIIVPSTVEY
ncbi:MAG: OmpA family protein [Saprospiraceae bacterium]|nr:OmpA family protein [Saprospiraceae bacterium]